MKIEGIGNVKKEEMMSILTSSGRQAVKDGDMSMEEVSAMYKLEQIKKASNIGKYGNTFSANFARIPEGLFEKLSPAELASLVDAFYICYGDGKNSLNSERLEEVK